MGEFDSLDRDALDPGLPGAARFDPMQIVAIVRRRWPIMLGTLALVLLGTAWWQNGRPDLYTSELLLERESGAAGLISFNAPFLAQPGSDIASQIEILKSRGVLGPAVDSLGLRLVLPDGVQRSQLFEEVSVSMDALPARYVLERNGDDVVLRREDSGTVVARAAPGGVLAARDLRIDLADRAPVRQRTELAVVFRASAIGQLREDMEVRQIIGTSIIRLRYSSPDPDFSARVLNTVASSLQRQTSALAQEEARRRREFIGSQLTAVQDSLRAAQELLLAYQERSGTIDPEVEGRALLESIQDAERDMRTLAYRESVLRTLVQALDEGTIEDDAALRRIVALGDEFVPGAAETYDRLQELRMERGRMTASPYGYTQSGSEVQVVDSLIAETESEIRAMAREALRITAAARDAAEARARSIQGELGVLPGRSTSFTRFAQQARSLQDNFNLLAEKYYEAQIAEAVRGGDIEVVDPAFAPVSPEAQHPVRNLLLALFAGIGLALTLAIAIDYFDPRLHGGDDAERATGLPVLALIPVPEGANGFGDALIATRRGHPGGEAFRALANTLRFSTPDTRRVLAFISSDPAEGKSSVVANLGAALAGQQRVLVIDANLEHPRQHEIFGVPAGPGLMQVLSGKVEAAAAVRQTASGANLLPAGTDLDHGSNGMLAPRLRQVIETVRQSFDVVLIDSPAASVSSDATLIAGLADGTLFVIRSGHTLRAAARQTIDQLRRVRTEIDGVVLTGVQEWEADYGHATGGPSSNGRRSVVAALRRRLHR